DGQLARGLATRLHRSVERAITGKVIAVGAEARAVHRPERRRLKPRRQREWMSAFTAEVRSGAELHQLTLETAQDIPGTDFSYDGAQGALRGFAASVLLQLHRLGGGRLPFCPIRCWSQENSDRGR